MIGYLPAWGAAIAAVALVWLPINIWLVVREVRHNTQEEE